MFTSAEITQLLQQLNAGDKAAKDKLFECVYHELRRQASAYLRHERSGHTLQTTDLVHEAYFKLVDAARVEWQDRSHFLSIASRAMRQVVIDHARRHASAKRGGEQRRVDLDAVQIAVVERAGTLVALDDALTRLTAFSPRLGQVVELRFFGGLTEEETARVLGVTDRTIRRDWIKARGWLHQQLALDAEN